MSSRTWKGAKQGVAGNCCHQQNSTTSKILQPAKIGYQWSKGRTRKFLPPMQKLGRTKEKGNAQGVARVCHQHNLVQDSKFQKFQHDN
jgi:hypothetical protein